jgi:mitochondrial fission protein ELM1
VRPIETDDVCWVLTTGEAGMRSQARGLAEAIGLPVTEKRIAVRPPWSWLAGGLLPMPLSALDARGDPLTPPWPRLVVSCGRRSVGPALAVKRLSGGCTIAVHVQNPRIGRGKFDLVTAMAHDGIRGPNVVLVRTALHHITQARLAAARREWRSRLAPDSAPLLGVLVGGDNRSYRLTGAVTARLVRILRSAHARRGMKAAVTPSRRTGEAGKRMLAEALRQGSLGTFWNEAEPNPYLGILALADRLIVTSDSISMISEALAAGRPVHVLPLEGHGRRHDTFLQHLAANRLVSRIEGDDLDWSFAGQEPIDATAATATRIREMLDRESQPPAVLG